MICVQRCARGSDGTGMNIRHLPTSEDAMNTSIDVFQHPRTARQDVLPRDDADTSYKPPRARSRHEEAAAALAAAVADVFRPLLDNLNQLRSFRTVFDVEDYHIGMPFGALLACVALYQVWKLDPSTCLDMVLAYAFYKLSVVAADLRKRGLSNDLVTRFQLAIALTMAFKDAHKKCVPLDNIRFPVFIIYTVSVAWDLAGVKEEAKSALMDFIA